MNRVRHAVGLIIGYSVASAAAICLTQLPARSQAGQTIQKPTFRGAITVVPLEVRVVGRDGQPVTGLEQHEFTILEDGVARDITVFERHILAPADAQPGLRARADAALFDVSPADFRVFLIIAADGSLTPDYFKTIDALARFVRERLLPQDQIAVVAGGRATDFTTDHEAIAQGIERLANRRAWGGPANTNTKAQRDPVFRDRPQIEYPPAPEPNLGFAEYVNAPVRTGSEAEVVRQAIGYLRYLPGEKHLVALSRSGLSFGSMADVKRLAVEASDARVALHVILTGGIPPGDSSKPPTGLFGADYAIDTRPPGDAAQRNPDERPDRPAENVRVGVATRTESSLGAVTIRPMISGPVPIPGYSLADLIRHGDNRAVARMTGGQASTNAMAATALNRIDTSSRCYYLLAYSPSNPLLDGRYRSIKVKVSRPGVTVLTRSGYVAREAPPVPDRRTYLTENRIAAAGWYTDPIHDIRVEGKVSLVADGPSASRQAIIDFTIEATRLALANVDGRHVGSLNVALFCGDKREAIVGELRQTLDLVLNDETYERVMKEGLHHTARVPVKRLPRYVKVIVYDYGSDLLGSVLFTLPNTGK